MKRITGEEFIGQTFCRLTIIRVVGFKPRRGAIVACSCSCGDFHEAKLGDIRSGDIKSCGCLLREKLSLPTHLRTATGRKRVITDPVAKRESQERWKAKNKDKVAATAKRFRERHKDEVRAIKAAYYQREKPRIIAQLNHRFLTDIRFRIEMTIRGRIRKALRIQKAIKAKRMLELLGCTLEEFRVHIQSLFTDGMSWEKVLAGDIHVDHLRPIRAFNLLDPREQEKAFHFSNQGPKWKTHNLSKSDLLPDGTRARDIKHPESAPAPASALDIPALS